MPRRSRTSSSNNMSALRVAILGCGGAVPAHGRHPSAQLVMAEGFVGLVDCGEGTQFRLKAMHLPWGKIRYIFISHLHGDHVYGLPPLLTTWHLTGRTLPLDIWSPPGLEDMITHLFAHTRCRPGFPIRFHEVQEGDANRLVVTRNVTVRSFPLRHRIPCSGFLIEAEVTSGGDRRAFPRIDVTDMQDNDKSILRYAYCSDTAFDENILRHVRGANLMYHEATFREMHRDKATQTGHSTALDAANLAAQAEVGQLLIGHFSARYPDAGLLLAEARQRFPATNGAEEGQVYVVT